MVVGNGKFGRFDDHSGCEVAGTAIPGTPAAREALLQPEKRRQRTDIAGAEDHYGDMDFKVAGWWRGGGLPNPSTVS